MSPERVVNDQHWVMHYFSGTGNTFRVASWIAEAARARGATAELRPVTAGQAAETASAPVPDILGILTPTHGFTAPWAVLKHVTRLPEVKGRDAFVMATRAGWYVGPARLPGFEGTATWLLAAVLAARGAKVVGVGAIDMPSNWTALHWGLTDAHVATISGRGQERAEKFADAFLGGRTMITGWLSLAGGLLLAPASLGYMLIARPLLGKLLFADERCTSCGACAKHCPLDAIEMRGDAPGRPYWTFRCESCMRCMNVCPEDAIQASWAAAAAETYLLLAAVGLLAPVAAGAGLGSVAT